MKDQCGPASLADNGHMADERETTEPGATVAVEEARKLKARELNELIRYTMWSVFRVADRAALDAAGREACRRRGDRTARPGGGQGHRHPGLL